MQVRIIVIKIIGRHFSNRYIKLEFEIKELTKLFKYSIKDISKFDVNQRARHASW